MNPAPAWFHTQMLPTILGTATVASLFVADACGHIWALKPTRKNATGVLVAVGVMVVLFVSVAGI